MKVEREIAGIALPFMAGVLITAHAEQSFCIDYQAVSIISLGVTAMVLVWLLYRYRSADKDIAWREKWSDSSIRSVVCLGVFSCGVLSAATELFMGIEWPSSRSEIMARQIQSGLQLAIDSIPFQSTDTGALIKALLTGDRSSLSPAVTSAFRASGASHILALSGLHLGIIYMIFSKLSGILGNGRNARRYRSLILILLCGTYTMATGAGASIVRAFLFIFLTEIARLCGRGRSLSQLLFASLLLHLTISPLSVLSVSFQLSYSAMAGIAFIFPWVKGLWPEKDTAETTTGRHLSRAMRWIWTSAALSISCQLTTGPLAYIYFGTFPKYFLLTNLIALPLTGILIPCAALTLCLSAIGICPMIVVTLTERFSDTLTWALEVIATM